MMAMWLPDRGPQASGVHSEYTSIGTRIAPSSTGLQLDLPPCPGQVVLGLTTVFVFSRLGVYKSFQIHPCPRAEIDSASDQRSVDPACLMTRISRKAYRIRGKY